MQRGTVIVNGVEHVGRMFDADPTIDRASVELCTELFTDDVMVSVANATVQRYELTLYRRHSSGIDRWYPHTVPVAARQGDQQPATAPSTRAEAAPATKAAVKAKPKPEVQQEVQPAVQPEVRPAVQREARAEITPEAQPEVQPERQAEVAPAAQSQTPAPVPARAEPRNNLNAPPITQAVPVTAPASAGVPPPPPITQTIPVTAAPTTQIPVTMPAPTAQIPVTPPPAASANEVDATAIADEVAEAIKRAFAGMGAGF
jgi:hypothetical protein